MMPKEKAQRLMLKYYDKIEHTLSIEYEQFDLDLAKDCALIAVDEIIKTLNYDIKDLDVRGNILLDLIKYWKEVKLEIEKL